MSTTNKDMDHIAILSVIGLVKATSKKAFSVTTLLYTYIQSITAVDESLEALHSEVNEVRGVLDALDCDLGIYRYEGTKLFGLPLKSVWEALELAGRVERLPTDASDMLFKLLAGPFRNVFELALRDTQRTVATLEKALRALRPAPKAGEILKKDVQQIQLNLSAEDITNIRAYIHTHSTNLQLALAVLNWSVNPDIVINGISPKLSGITPRLELLTAMICRLTMASSPTSKGLLSQVKKPQVECRDSIIDAIHTMLERLMEMVSKLETVHIAETNDNIPKGFQNPDIMHNTQQMMHCAMAIITGAGTQPNSSVSDDLSDVTRKARTEQWIYGLGYEGEASGSTDTSPSPIATPQTTIAGSIAGSQHDRSDETDSELDEEIDIELVQRMFARGLREYREAHFGEAVKFLKTGIDRATRLSHTRQNSLLIEKHRLHLVSSHAEMNLRRAFMKIREGSLMESERVFHSILQQPLSNNDEDRRRRLHTASGLAHIHLWRGHFNDAERWCYRSVAGWNRLVGKGHSFYRISLRLMQAIHEAKGDLVTASVLSELMTDLPAEAKSLTQVDEELKFFISPGYNEVEARLVSPTVTIQCAAHWKWMEAPYG